MPRLLNRVDGGGNVVNSKNGALRRFPKSFMSVVFTDRKVVRALLVAAIVATTALVAAPSSMAEGQEDPRIIEGQNEPIIVGSADPTIEIVIPEDNPYTFISGVIDGGFLIDTSRTGLTVDRVEGISPKLARIYFEGTVVPDGTVEPTGTIFIRLTEAAFIEKNGQLLFSNELAIGVLEFGMPTSIEIRTQPSGGTSGQTFSTPAAVRIVDQYDNTVRPNGTVQVIASLQSGTGELQGETEVIASDGVATFSNLTITGSGEFTITFTIAGSFLPPATSETITIQTAPIIVTQSEGFFVLEQDLGELHQWLNPDSGTAFGEVIDDRDGTRSLTALDVLRVTTNRDCSTDLTAGNENIADLVKDCLDTDSGVEVQLVFRATDSDGSHSEETSISFVSSPTPEILEGQNEPISIGSTDPFLGVLIPMLNPFEFKTEIEISDFIIETGRTGLTVNRVERPDPQWITIYFEGTVIEAGVISVKAKDSAFVLELPMFGDELVDSNQLEIEVSEFGFPTAIEIVTQPSGGTSGQPFSTPAAVRLVDQNGNTFLLDRFRDGDFEIEIIASIEAGNGELLGGTAVIGSNGIATFTNLTITGSGEFTITFTIPQSMIADATSDTIFIEEEPVVLFPDIDQDAEGAVNGYDFIKQPIIRVKDIDGNTVFTFNGEVVAELIREGRPNVLLGSASAISGIATFTSLRLETGEADEGTNLTIRYSIDGFAPSTQSIYLAKECNGIRIACNVGDIGPGGGIVFYVDMGGFDCPFIGDRCNYLEAARTAGDNPWVEDGQHYWSEDSAREFGTSEGIGAGLTNSQVMICPFDECYEYFVGGAALRARSFDYNARAFGWHLPSRAELQELDFRSNIVGLADDRNYWSSSEDDATQAWMLEDEVAGSGVVRSNSKNLTAYVRPIRAFSATVGPARNWFSTVSISDASIIADGSSTSVITVRLKDGFQNNLTSGGDEITFYTPDLGSIGATTDNGDGTYTAVYTSGISSERVLIWVAPLVNGQDLLFSASVELTARGEPIPVVVAPVVVAPVLVAPVVVAPVVVAPVVVAPVVVAPVVVTPAPSMNPTPSAQMLRVGTIFMAPGSYSLNDSTKTSLREMAKNIKNSKKKVIYVTGYPDRRMGENNTLLSQRRAKAVANYLQLFLKGKKIVVSRASTVKLLIPGNPVRDSGTNGGVEIRTK